MPKVTRFITTTKITSVDTTKYSIIILASLPLSRGIFTSPISLYPVNNTSTVIDVQYDTIKTVFPKSDVFIICGNNISQIVNKKPEKLRVIENQNYATCGEGEELKLAINATNTPSIITINGNLLFDEEALNQIKTKHSAVLVDSKSEAADGIGTVIDKSKIENMSYGLPNQWCGISHFSGNELKTLRTLINLKSKSNLCMFEIINNLIHNRHGIVYAVEHTHGRIQRIEK